MYYLYYLLTDTIGTGPYLPGDSLIYCCGLHVKCIHIDPIAIGTHTV